MDFLELTPIAGQTIRYHATVNPTYYSELSISYVSKSCGCKFLWRRGVKTWIYGSPQSGRSVAKHIEKLFDIVDADCLVSDRLLSYYKIISNPTNNKTCEDYSVNLLFIGYLLSRLTLSPNDGWIFNNRHAILTQLLLPRGLIAREGSAAQCPICLFRGEHEAVKVSNIPGYICTESFAGSEPHTCPFPNECTKANFRTNTTRLRTFIVWKDGPSCHEQCTYDEVYEMWSRLSYMMQSYIFYFHASQTFGHPHIHATSGSSRVGCGDQAEELSAIAQCVILDVVSTIISLLGYGSDPLNHVAEVLHVKTLCDLPRPFNKMPEDSKKYIGLGIMVMGFLSVPLELRGVSRNDAQSFMNFVNEWWLSPCSAPFHAAVDDDCFLILDEVYRQIPAGSPLSVLGPHKVVSAAYVSQHLLLSTQEGSFQSWTWMASHHFTRPMLSKISWSGGSVSTPPVAFFCDEDIDKIMQSFSPPLELEVFRPSMFMMVPDAPQLGFNIPDFTFVSYPQLYLWLSQMPKFSSALIRFPCRRNDVLRAAAIGAMFDAWFLIPSSSGLSSNRPHHQQNVPNAMAFWLILVNKKKMNPTFMSRCESRVIGHLFSTCPDVNAVLSGYVRHYEACIRSPWSLTLSARFRAVMSLQSRLGNAVKSWLIGCSRQILNSEPINLVDLCCHHGDGKKWIYYFPRTIHSVMGVDPDMGDQFLLSWQSSDKLSSIFPVDRFEGTLAEARATRPKAFLDATVITCFFGLGQITSDIDVFLDLVVSTSALVLIILPNFDLLLPGNNLPLELNLHTPTRIETIVIDGKSDADELIISMSGTRSHVDTMSRSSWNRVKALGSEPYGRTIVPLNLPEPLSEYYEINGEFLSRNLACFNQMYTTIVINTSRT